MYTHTIMFSEWLHTWGFGYEVFSALAELSVHSFPELAAFLGDNTRLAVLRKRLSDTLTLDLLIAVRTTVQRSMAAQPLAMFSPLSTAFAPRTGPLQGFPAPFHTPFQAPFQQAYSSQVPLQMPQHAPLKIFQQTSLQTSTQTSFPESLQAPLHAPQQTTVSSSALDPATSGSTDSSSTSTPSPSSEKFPACQSCASAFPSAPLPSLTAAFPLQSTFPQDANALVSASSGSHDRVDISVHDSLSALSPHRGSPSSSPHDQDSRAINTSRSSQPQHSQRAHVITRKDPSYSLLPMPTKFVIPPTVKVYPLSATPLPRSGPPPSPDSQESQDKPQNKRRRGFNWQLIYSFSLSDFSTHKEAQALAMRLKDFPDCVNEHRHSFNNVFRCRESLNCQHLTKVHHDELAQSVYIYQCDVHVGHPLTRSPSTDAPRRGLDLAVKEFIEKHAQEGLKPRKIFDMMVRHNAECKEEHLMLHLPTMKQVQNYYDRTHYDRKRPPAEADGHTAEEEHPTPPHCDDEESTKENVV